jgi:hypothetical protein
MVRLETKSVPDDKPKLYSRAPLIATVLLGAGYCLFMHGGAGEW